MKLVEVRTLDLAEMGDERLAEYADILDGEEKTRAARFVRDANRREFIAAHALKRMMLAEKLDISPKNLRFCTDKKGGKPRIDLPGGPDFRFNLSHTTAMVACAVAQGVEVGVDVEATSRHVDPGLANRFFAPDEAAWLAEFEGPARDQNFMALWTLKEAVVKALGLGLSAGLEGFSVRPNPARLLQHDNLLAHGQACQLHQWTQFSGHLVALAVISPSDEAIDVALNKV